MRWGSGFPVEASDYTMINIGISAGKVKAFVPKKHQIRIQM